MHRLEELAVTDVFACLERCQFCGESGFDAQGLAQHVRTYCDVVDRLYEKQMVELATVHERLRVRTLSKGTNHVD